MDTPCIEEYNLLYAFSTDKIKPFSLSPDSCSRRSKLQGSTSTELRAASLWESHQCKLLPQPRRNTAALLWPFSKETASKATQYLFGKKYRTSSPCPASLHKLLHRLVPAAPCLLAAVTSGPQGREMPPKALQRDVQLCPAVLPSAMFIILASTVSP